MMLPNLTCSLRLLEFFASGESNCTQILRYDNHNLVKIQHKNAKYVITSWGKHELTFNNIQQNGADSSAVLISGKALVGVSIFWWDFWKLLILDADETKSFF